jgi:hypothetical protein
MWKVCACVFVLMLTVSSLFAKDEVFQTVTWPDSGPAIIRFSFSKFKTVGTSGREHSYLTETIAENVSDKKISNAGFSLYVFDKSKARIGEGYISLSNVGPGETVKFEVRLTASGTPLSLAVVSTTPDSVARSFSVTINSVPQGAELKVDGKAMGITPKIIEVGIGKHVLEFSKEGFTSGKFPLEMTSHDASGGSVSYELGSAARDTIELRDGSILSGDVISVSGMQIEVRIGGNVQSFDRNQVKRILFTERDPPTN